MAKHDPFGFDKTIEPKPGEAVRAPDVADMSAAVLYWKNLLLVSTVITLIASFGIPNNKLVLQIAMCVAIVCALIWVHSVSKLASQVTRMVFRSPEETAPASDDQCPACGAQTANEDTECPSCGLSIN